MININGKVDASYRYKMEPLQTTACGKGNGMFTMINNLESVSKYINHPPTLILKYLGSNFGSQTNDMKQTIGGSHTTEELQSAFQTYINKFVICPSCGIPETIPMILKLNKKISSLELMCSACSSKSDVSKYKGSEHIIKYLEKNKWEINKGYMVNSNKPNEIQPNKIQDDDMFNPFD